jgi:hypothetical protein
MTTKYWILPDGSLSLAGSLHSRWLLENPSVATRFGLNLTGLTSDSDDTKIRLMALNKGFVRMNYQDNGGLLTIEAGQLHWNVMIKDVIWNFVSDHVSTIDNVNVNILASNGRLVSSASTQLFLYDDDEKLNHIPLVSETLERMVRTGRIEFANMSDKSRQYFIKHG